MTDARIPPCYMLQTRTIWPVVEMISLKNSSETSHNPDSSVFNCRSSFYDNL